MLSLDLTYHWEAFLDLLIWMLDLSAMEADGIGKVVSEPRVTTLDNKTAKISQGKKVPYQSMQQGQIQIMFYDALLSLNVTPHITSNKKVCLNTNHEQPC